MDKVITEPNKHNHLSASPGDKISLASNMDAEAGRSCYRILLVEDDQLNQVPTILLLERRGHTVVLAEDGRQALEMLRREHFDCILMDVQLPEMSGIEATRAIRESLDLGEKRTIPIIALTAYAMSGDREKFLQAGMDDYLAKPVMIADLEQVLARTCQLK
ncbi:response regulator [Desulfonatronum thioautotrophicum]|uniref:response regulator n=1 Tax=Desulfonatronum thioautotrophicum TaxID=617001 RepID=UPI0005EBCB3B|nr:response regulator [Desulfonatronum thioautotrophicum]